MYKDRPVSIISLALCAVVIALVTAALVFATNNSAEYRATLIRRDNTYVSEQNAFVKIYSKSEVENIARVSYANNYLAFYDNEVNLEGLEALVIGDLMQIIPQDQLNNFLITVTADSVDVIYLV